jgi:uncharacterized alkaline shock family protein YloU
MQRCAAAGKEDSVTPHTSHAAKASETGQPEKLGSVRVAPEVLATIASVTTQGVPGVARLQPGLAGEVGKFIGRGRPKRGNGVKIAVQNNEVSVEVHIVVKPEVSMVELGREVQESIAEAIETMIGMPVHAIDVYIEDVE